MALETPHDPAAPGPAALGPVGLLLAVLPGCLLAVLLFLPSRAAGHVSDDTAALAYVDRHGALADVAHVEKAPPSTRLMPTRSSPSGAALQIE